MSSPMFGLKILSRDLECEKGSVILLLTFVRVCFLGGEMDIGIIT